jgi:hypothetical protein
MPCSVFTQRTKKAQLKTFVSTLARRSIIGLKTAMAVFSHVFAGRFGRIYGFQLSKKIDKYHFFASLHR